MNLSRTDLPDAEKRTSYPASLLSEKARQGRLVLDCSLEAFLEGFTDEKAQTAHGSGGLGFLAGETYGAYKEVGVNAIGCIPGYATLKQGDSFADVDWAKSGAIPLLDDTGRTVTCNVSMNGEEYPTEFWVVEEKGTPVILLKQPKIFYVKYVDDPEQRLVQYMFFGKALVEICKQLRIDPSIVRINEAQLAPVLMAIGKHREDTRGQMGAILGSTDMVFTNHTQERAALPSWANRQWVEKIIGTDVIPGNAWSELPEYHPMVVHDLAKLHCGAPCRIGEGGVKYYQYLSPLNYALVVSAVVNGVSGEHGTISREIIFPTQAPDQRLSPNVSRKILTVTNGSDRERWTSRALHQKQQQHIDAGGTIDDVTGEELLAARSETKNELSTYLQKNGLPSIEHTNGRPLIALTRRHVAYKEIGTLIPLVEWMCGDQDKEYDIGGGVMKRGLGANVLIGGVASDPEGLEWKAEFEGLQKIPALKGRFVFAPRTGIEFMRLCTGSADFWIHGPRQTREACGTSYERAVFSGGWNICTATGGPMEHIQDGKNGSIVDLFPEMESATVAEIFDYSNVEVQNKPGHFEEHPEKRLLIQEFQSRWQQYLLQKLPELIESHANPVAAAKTAKDVYGTSETMDIATMAKHYRDLYDSVINKNIQEKIADGTLTPAQPFSRRTGVANTTL